MPDEVMSLSDVSFGYESGAVVSDINFDLRARDYVVLLGANGAGKTTLVKVALGLLQPLRGTATLFGMPARDARARTQIGYVPQRAAISARVPATVEEVVVAGRAGRGFGRFSRRDHAAARDALVRVGLPNIAGTRVGELSGGQQQRVLIARALVSDPMLLVLDEPTAGVDQESQLRFAAVLRELNREGVAILIVAHDLGAVGGDVRRVLLLHQGHIDEIPIADARAQVGLFVKDHH